MCGEPQWVVARFLPNQRLPDGYEVGGEWGDIGDWKVGFGCWYWHKQQTGEFGMPHRTKWAARRDAIRHAAATPASTR